jgi:hypothetical protein
MPLLHYWTKGVISVDTASASFRLIWAWPASRKNLGVWGTLGTSSIMLQKSCSSDTYLSLL